MDFEQRREAAKRQRENARRSRRSVTVIDEGQEKLKRAREAQIRRGLLQKEKHGGKSHQEKSRNQKNKPH